MKCWNLKKSQEREKYNSWWKLETQEASDSQLNCKTTFLLPRMVSREEDGWWQMRSTGKRWGCEDCATRGRWKYSSALKFEYNSAFRRRNHSLFKHFYTASPNTMKMHPSSSRAFQIVATQSKASWFCEILLEKDACLLLLPRWLSRGRGEDRRDEMRWNCATTRWAFARHRYLRNCAKEPMRKSERGVQKGG